MIVSWSRGAQAPRAKKDMEILFSKLNFLLLVLLQGKAPASEGGHYCL
jgi:hypothetical protein